MTIGGWDDEDKHVTDGWEDVTMMILKRFINRKQYVEILVWGFYWKTGDLIWDDGNHIHMGTSSIAYVSADPVAIGVGDLLWQWYS